MSRVRTGTSGRHVVEELSRGGVKVVTLDRDDAAPAGSSLHVAADLFDEDFSIVRAIGEAPDACLHLAWQNGFDHSSLSHIDDIPGHFSFLSRLIEEGVPQIAVMGSMHEVGYWEGAINEATPCNPLSYYGVSKLALRQLVSILAKNKGVCFQWLRGYYIYGDDVFSQSIFGKIARAARDGATEFPFTTGKNKYDFLRIDELARQIALCVSQDAVTGVIECCSGVPVSLAEQVEKFIEERGFDIALRYGAFPDRPYDSPAVWGDPERNQ